MHKNNSLVKSTTKLSYYSYTKRLLTFEYEQ